MIFLGLGERADFNPIVHGNFGFISLIVRFELFRFDFDGHLIFAVGLLDGFRGERAIGEERDVLK